MVRRLVWTAVAVGVLLVFVGVVPAAYVFGPLVGYGIWRFGMATFGSLRAGASYIPDGAPEAIDPARERITYWCDGCGAELLLLVRGTESPPRHCGERMVERHEIARDATA